MHICMSHHLPTMDGQIDPSLVIVLANLEYMLCQKFLGGNHYVDLWLML